MSPKIKYRTLKLTPEQSAYSIGVDWLIKSTARCQGKTLLMAKAFVEKAIENVGQWVYLYDHNGNGYHYMDSLISKVHDVFSDIEFEYPTTTGMVYRIEYRSIDKSIRVVLKYKE
jgi:hypothetical protein